MSGRLPAVAHGPYPPHGGPDLLVWYSLAGMLSASAGAWVVAFAKFAWERLEHVLMPSSVPLPQVLTQAGNQGRACSPFGTLLHFCLPASWRESGGHLRGHAGRRRVSPRIRQALHAVMSEPRRGERAGCAGDSRASGVTGLD